MSRYLDTSRLLNNVIGEQMSVMKLLASVMLIVGALSGTSMAKDHHSSGRAGVFGRINGKVVKAHQRDGLDDRCVTAFTVTGATGQELEIIVQGQCLGRGFHEHVKSFTARLDINCGPDSRTPSAIHAPEDIGCYEGTYTEPTRRGIKTWMATNYFLSDPGGDFNNSTLHMHIESFEGGWVRGSFSGVFDLMCVSEAGCSPTSTPAVIQSANFYVQVHDLGVKRLP